MEHWNTTKGSPTMAQSPALSYGELYRRLRGVPLNDGERAAISDMKDGACDWGAMILELTKPSPEQTLATRALEEAVMWATKAIALHGVAGPDGS